MRVAHGQVWSVTLDPTVANEQRGTRPCVVVSTVAAITDQLVLWLGHRN